MYNSYKPVNFDQIIGSLTIESQSSQVTGTDIKVEHVKGDLEVDGRSCSGMAEDISGDVSISNSYKYVVLKQTSGSIIVHGSSSPIEVSRIRKLPKDGKIELITTYKPILLYLPRNADVAVLADSRYGKIKSDFPVYIKDKDKEQTQIEIGEGSTFIRLETSGNITLRKE